MTSCNISQDEIYPKSMFRLVRWHSITNMVKIGTVIGIHSLGPHMPILLIYINPFDFKAYIWDCEKYLLMRLRKH